MTVFISDEQDEPLDLETLRTIAEGVLDAERLPEGTEVAVMLVPPDQMAEYNRRFMEREGPTDVLAFPVLDLEPGSLPRPVANEPPLVLGDVFLCPDEIVRRAQAERIDDTAFLELLLVHGILHLLGYDHSDERSARRMEEREEQILVSLGRELP
ncbi:MAG: rRNA maturation RNase YbeY [Acidimicrobiia bacterium]|nr:rRNA maturation RNase YbeY [Acidimicrobiia bacterium]